MTKGRWYAKENNEKSLVYHWSLKLIEAFRRLQAAQTLWEFVGFWIYKKCMKINKLRSKFYFLTKKIEIKMTGPVFFLFAYSAISKPF